MPPIVSFYFRSLEGIDNPSLASILSVHVLWLPKSQFVITRGDVAVILDSLKKPLDNITLFIQFGIKVMLSPEIGFIGDTSKGSVLFKVTANLLATVCSLSARIVLAPRDAPIA